MPFSITSCFRAHHSSAPQISSPIQQKQPETLATLENTTLEKNTLLVKRVSLYGYSLHDTSSGKDVDLVQTEMQWLSKLSGVTGKSKSTS